MPLTTPKPVRPRTNHLADRSPSRRWQLTGVSPDPRKAAPPLQGLLDLGSALVAHDLEFRATLTPIGGRLPVDVTVQARVIGLDHSGDWLLFGTAVMDDAPAEVTIRIHDFGDYRQGDRHTRWLRLQLEALPTRRRSRLLRRTQRHDRFELHVNGAAEGD